MEITDQLLKNLTFIGKKFFPKKNVDQINRAALARYINLEQSSVRNWFQKKTNISYPKLLILSEKISVLLSNDLEKSLSIRPENLLNDDLEDKLRRNPDSFRKSQKTHLIVPILSNVPDYPYTEWNGELEKNQIDSIYIDSDNSNLFAVKVPDNSMVPAFLENDIVIIDPTKDLPEPKESELHLKYCILKLAGKSFVIRSITHLDKNQYLVQSNDIHELTSMDEIVFCYPVVKMIRTY